jgi:RHS repeat-associated protein
LFQPVSFNLPSFNLIPLQQGGAVTINYEYDPLHRLKTVTYSDGRSFTYSYDAVGNVLQYTQTQDGSTVTTTYDYNRANQLTTAQADNSPIVWHYVYDANGRLTEVLPDGVPANGAKRYTYHTAGFLVKAEAHDGSAYQPQAEMLYNGLGQRLRMTGYALGTSVTTTYVLDLMENARPLSATSNGNTTYYVYGLGPVAEFTTEWSYSLPDGTNTPRQLTNANGEITLSGKYTPWGDSLEYTGTGNFTFGYFGGMMDAATGLLYVGNGQYYDPATGRFLTRDVNPNSTNPYVPWGDPSGALLGPLALLGLIYGRKRKKNGFDYFVIVLFVMVGIGMGLSACAPAPAPSGTPQPPSVPPSGNSTPVPPPSNPTTTPPPPVQPSGTATSTLDEIFPYPCPTPTWTPTPTETPYSGPDIISNNDPVWLTQNGEVFGLYDGKKMYDLYLFYYNLPAWWHDVSFDTDGHFSIRDFLHLIIFWEMNGIGDKDATAISPYTIATAEKISYWCARYSTEGTCQGASNNAILNYIATREVAHRRYQNYQNYMKSGKLSDIGPVRNGKIINEYPNHSFSVPGTVMNDALGMIKPNGSLWDYGNISLLPTNVWPAYRAAPTGCTEAKCVYWRSADDLAFVMTPQQIECWRYGKCPP